MGIEDRLFKHDGAEYSGAVVTFDNPVLKRGFGRFSAGESFRYAIIDLDLNQLQLVDLNKNGQRIYVGQYFLCLMVQDVIKEYPKET